MAVRPRVVIRRKTAYLRMRLAWVGGITDAGKAYNSLRGSGRKEGILMANPVSVVKGFDAGWNAHSHKPSPLLGLQVGNFSHHLLSIIG